MASVLPIAELLAQKIEAAKKTGKLQLSFAAMMELPPNFVDKARKNVPQLLEVDLQSNRLVTLPDNLAELKTVRILKLKYNSFAAIPPVVFQMPKLQILDFSGNHLTAVADQIAVLKNLRELDLSGNQLTQLPPTITKLTQLNILNLESNQLEFLPDDLGSLSALTRLDLSSNQLTSLPDSIGDLRSLVKIDVSNNALTKIPPKMGRIASLMEFDVRYNELLDSHKQAADRGIEAFLQFLRDEEEREVLEEIERQKPIPITVGSYKEYKMRIKDEVRYDENGYPVTVEHNCWSRTGHTAVLGRRGIFIFGGFVHRTGAKTNEVHLLNLDRLQMETINCAGDKPPPRDGHCAVYDADKNRLVIFGGKTEEKRKMNDVFVLDLDNAVWFKATTEGAAPAPREGAAYCLIPEQRKMVIFGGKGVRQRYNDLYMLDLDTFRWSQPAYGGNQPSPRQGAAICYYENKIFCHGGRSNLVLQDLYVVDLVENEWRQIECMGNVAPPRYNHQLYAKDEKLYLFSGRDELDAFSMSLYRLPLPAEYSITFLTRNPPEWMDMESELPATMNKVDLIDRENVYMILAQPPPQGPQTPANVIEDFERGKCFLDTFKVAPLMMLQDKETGSQVYEEGAKRSRMESAMTGRNNMPASYLHNSKLEVQCLEHVDKFQKAFTEIYPKRRPLFLSPLNEAGVRKFVCSTIRPSKLQYTELYNYETCAQFVADFIRYEPLENPVQMPDYLPSPASVLTWQVGDAFDMSVLLCSLLIGVGYDAYVAVGYAPRYVTLNDQKDGTCPFLERMLVKEREGETVASSAGDDKENQKKAKYSIRPGVKSTSTYEEALKAKEREAEAKKRLEKDLQKQREEQQRKDADRHLEAMMDMGMVDAYEGEDEHKGRRVHAWVLVLKGERELAQDLFIEPSTGAIYPGLAKAPYEGIEFVFNHRNFWVNMQLPEPHSDARNDVTEMKYDLANPRHWEPILPNASWGYLPPEDRPMSVGMLAGVLGGMPATGGATSRVGTAAAAPQTARPQTTRTPGDGFAPGPESARGVGSATVTASPPQSAVDVERSARRTTTAGNTLPPMTPMPGVVSVSNMFGAGPNLGQGDLTQSYPIVQMPPSWVVRLSVPRVAFDTRCPRGQKVILYRRCKHEIFALFGECARWDGCVDRVTTFEDETCYVVKESREYFMRRKDKLRERITRPPEDAIIERFDPGAVSGVKEIISIRGKLRKTTFYPTARLDGLAQREETFIPSSFASREWGNPEALIPRDKTVETFLHRDDRMVYRSVRYEPVSAEYVARQIQRKQQEQLAYLGINPALAQQNMVAGGAAGDRKLFGDSKAEYLQPIRKISEKYARTPGKPADEDVCKRVFYVADDEIRLVYHFGEGRITQSSKVFGREGMSHIIQVDPLAPEPEEGAIFEEYQALVQAEKESIQSVRDVEAEAKEIKYQRLKEEQHVVLVTPYYEVMRQKIEDSDDDHVEDEATGKDYLASYLPVLPGNRKRLNRSEALDVRDKVLKALKERLIARANILQSRYDEEQQFLLRKQANYQRDRDIITREEEEKYEKECEEAMFRIKILEQRLKRHEEESVSSYYALDSKLRSDERLSSLMEPDA